MSPPTPSSTPSTAPGNRCGKKPMEPFPNGTLSAASPHAGREKNEPVRRFLLAHLVQAQPYRGTLRLPIPALLPVGHFGNHTQAYRESHKIQAGTLIDAQVGASASHVCVEDWGGDRWCGPCPVCAGTDEVPYQPVVKPRVAPRVVRRPPDKARRGSLSAIGDRGATPCRRDASPLECSGGFTTGCYCLNDWLAPEVAAAGLGAANRDRTSQANSGWPKSTKKTYIMSACEGIGS